MRDGDGHQGRDDGPQSAGEVGAAKEIVGSRRLVTEIEADGGIRRETVPVLKAAGADWIVPGSLDVS